MTTYEPTEQDIRDYNADQANLDASRQKTTTLTRRERTLLNLLTGLLAATEESQIPTTIAQRHHAANARQALLKMGLIGERA